MGVQPVAGTKFFIAPPGSVPSPDSYVEVKDIANLGNLSQQFAQVSVESIGDGDSYSLKGTRSFPNFEITMNLNAEDEGQAAIKAAADAPRGTLYNFKTEDEDGSIATWKGEAFGYGPNYGSANSVRQVQTSISIRPSTFVMTLAD